MALICDTGGIYQPVEKRSLDASSERKPIGNGRTGRPSYCFSAGIYALYDADDIHHIAVRAVVEAEAGPLYLPSILLAELDYLLTTRLGPNAELDFLEGLSDGAYVLIHPTAEDLVRCRELIVQYRDLSLGLADASVVVTAERLGIPRLLTVDERHFRVVQATNFSHFVLLPADTA